MSTPEDITPGAQAPGAGPDGPAVEPATPTSEADVDAAAPDPDLAPEELAADAETEAPDPDYRDLYVRAVAETDNVRKRARRDVDVAHSRGVAKLAKELLPALDNLERALAAAEAAEGEGGHPITSGIRLVQKELVASLERVGIVPDLPKGERFDPHRHDAVAQMPVEGAESGTITEVYSAGYRFGEDVLRPAKVVVAQ